MENHAAIVIIISFMNKMVKHKDFASNYEQAHLYFSKYIKNPLAFLMLIMCNTHYCSSKPKPKKKPKDFS